MIYGKVYGSRGSGAQTLGSDLFYGDLRWIAFYPTDHTVARGNGTATMQASASANVPVTSVGGADETRIIATYNIAPLGGAGLREAYVRWSPGQALKAPPDKAYLVFGQFVRPFGLFTDEHRTYTRLQNDSTLNNFVVGGAASAPLTDDLHGDLALVNDLHNGGVFDSNNLSFATVLNLRWNPKALPFLVGASGEFEHDVTVPAPYAGSLYGVLSLDRISQNSISGAVLMELEAAKNWNNPAVNKGASTPSLQAFFIPNSATAYTASIADAPSLGAIAQAKYNLTDRWQIFYKFEALALNLHDLGENYVRQGIGFEHRIGTNLILNARVEFASAPTAFARSDILAEYDDILAMMRLWL